MSRRPAAAGLVVDFTGLPASTAARSAALAL